MIHIVKDLYEYLQEQLHFFHAWKHELMEFNVPKE